jgi:hypothetical protein
MQALYPRFPHPDGMSVDEMPSQLMPRFIDAKAIDTVGKTPDANFIARISDDG